MPEMIDREATVVKVRAFLESQGLVRVRQDRFALSEDPPHGAPNLEIGTVYGEVRIRINVAGAQVDKVDIRSEAHLPAAYKRIETALRRIRGMHWVRGKGWTGGDGFYPEGQ